eukprot:2005482-Karenia_brevis.AAC.1
MGDIGRYMSTGERVRFVEIQNLCRSFEAEFDIIRVGMDRLAQHKKAAKEEEAFLRTKKHVLPTPVFRCLYDLEA